MFRVFLTVGAIQALTMAVDLTRTITIEEPR